MSNPLPPELRNNPVVFDPQDGVPAEIAEATASADELNDILEPDDDDLAFLEDEALTAVGAEIEIAGVRIPPPTAGVLMMMEIIESPFVAVDPPETLEIEDVFNALYLMVERLNALPVVAEYAKNKRMAKRAFDATEKTPAHLEVYLRHVERTANRVSLEDEVTEFALANFGSIDPVEVSAEIARYIKLSMGGFEMLQDSTSDPNRKKKDVSLLNGSPRK